MPNMPTSTFGSFEIAKSGLSVAMQQLNVTEQNIANVNTEGYTRQRLLTSAKDPANGRYLVAQLSKTLVGQGVEALGIQQIRSEYLDKQYRTLNSNYNQSSARSTALEYLTGVMNELGEKGTITTAIDKFFSALNTFASNTSSQEYRTNVQQQALGMTQTFNNIYEEVQSLWHNQNDSVAIAAQKINSIAQKIANLNDAIAKFEQTGGTANDLNDERNLLIDELSGYVNITYDFNPDNSSMIDIKIGGLTLVEGKAVNEIVVDSAKDLIDDIVNGDAAAQAAASTRLTELGFTCTETGGVYDVSFNGIALVTAGAAVPNIDNVVSSDLTLWVAYNRNNLTVNSTPPGALELGTVVTSGKLCSYMEMVSNQDAVNAGIPFYMEQINSFVREIAKNLNEIAASGYTYPYTLQDGTPVASQTGINLFHVPDSGGGPDYTLLNAGNFSLSAEVLESVWNIAGSSTPVDLTAGATESGNNVIALRLFQDLVENSYYDKLNSIVGNLSIDANTTDSILSTKESLLLSTDTQRQSLSSVSLDEETTNLIIFQQSYQACARVITTLDEMLNTMINNMGITGR